MAIEVNVTQQDIDALARKLDGFGGGLSDRERSLLLGIFALAGKRLRDSRANAGNGSTQTQLARGFRDAFQPGVGGKIALGSGNDTEGFGIDISYKTL
jgi:hypothetical protein